MVKYFSILVGQLVFIYNGLDSTDNFVSSYVSKFLVSSTSITSFLKLFQILETLGCTWN